MKLKIRDRIQNYIRVLKIAKKPSLDEFNEAIKICLTGLIVVGIFGFVVYVISVLFMG